MRLGLRQRLNGMLTLVDVDDEDAPMVLVELCNEFAQLPIRDQNMLQLAMFEAFVAKWKEIDGR